MAFKDTNADSEGLDNRTSGYLSVTGGVPKSPCCIASMAALARFDTPSFV
jgi:hypothetical protein